MNATGFAGFPAETLDFMRGLKANNTRDWFAQNKRAYERVFVSPARQFGAFMEGELEAMTGIAHGSKTFRIHRDLRFSKDKTPYHTHLHISIVPKTGLSSSPSWFFGLSPDYLSLGTGLFGFDKTALEAYRERVAGSEGDVLAGLLKGLSDAGHRISEPELKRVPAGYDKAHRNGDLLRHKSLAVWRDFPDISDATRAGIVGTSLEAFAAMRPAFEWLLGAAPD